MGACDLPYTLVPQSSHENQQFLPKTTDLFALGTSLEEALPFGHL
jgi:hypothetical protein